MASLQQEKNLKRAQKICYSKIPHRSRLSAENALDQMVRLPDSSKLLIYTCPICGLLHIGRQNDYLTKKLKEDDKSKQNFDNNSSDIITINGSINLSMEE